jgi:hypothetical protein
MSAPPAALGPLAQGSAMLAQLLNGSAQGSALLGQLLGSGMASGQRILFNGSP